MIAARDIKIVGALLLIFISACCAQIYKPLKCYVCADADGASEDAYYNPDGLLKTFPSRPGFDFSKFVPHRISKRCSQIYNMDPRYHQGQQWTGAPMQSYWPEFETECETSYDGLLMKGFCMRKEVYVGNNRMIVRYCQPYLDGLCPYDQWSWKSKSNCCKDRPLCNRSPSVTTGYWTMTVLAVSSSLWIIMSRSLY